MAKREARSPRGRKRPFSISMRQPSSQLKRWGKALVSGASFKRGAEARSQAGRSKSESLLMAGEGTGGAFRSNDSDAGATVLGEVGDAGMKVGRSDPCCFKEACRENRVCLAVEREVERSVGKVRQ